MKNTQKHWECVWCKQSYSGHQTFVETHKLETQTGFSPDKEDRENIEQKKVSANTTRRFKKMTPACNACIQANFPEERRDLSQ